MCVKKNGGDWTEGSLTRGSRTNERGIPREGLAVASDSTRVLSFRRQSLDLHLYRQRGPTRSLSLSGKPEGNDAAFERTIRIVLEGAVSDASFDEERGCGRRGGVLSIQKGTMEVGGMRRKNGRCDGGSLQCGVNNKPRAPLHTRTIIIIINSIHKQFCRRSRSKERREAFVHSFREVF